MKIYELRNGDKVYLGETDKYVDFGQLLLIDSNYYECCSRNTQKELFVRWVCVDSDLPQERENYSEDYLVCPYCGYEDEDSFELADEDDEYECPRCKSILKYNRQITVSYDVELVKEEEPIKLELK